MKPMLRESGSALPLNPLLAGGERTNNEVAGLNAGIRVEDLTEGRLRLGNHRNRSQRLPQAPRLVETIEVPSGRLQ